MKNYKYIKVKSMLLAAIVCLTMASCGDFLKIEPRDFVSEDNFWDEEKDIDQMVTGVYVKMQQDAFIRRCIVWGESRSDNVIEGQNCTGYIDLYRTIQNQLYSTNAFADWGHFYNIINQCNIISDRAPEVSEKDPNFTQSEVLATQAEVAFLRDLCYFYLVRAFKDVPYYTEAKYSDDDAVDIGATDGDVIVAALIADLESKVGNALKAYPEDKNPEYYNSNCNRVTQNAIYALLADLCLWNGDYKKCVDYAQKVIDAKCREYREDYSRNYSYRDMEKGVGSPELMKWDGYTDGDEYESKYGYPLYPCYIGELFGNNFNAIFGSTGNSFESIFELAYTYNGGSAYLVNIPCADLYGNYYSGDMKINNDKQYSGNQGHGFLAVEEKIASNDEKVFRHNHDCRFYEYINPESSGASSVAGRAYPAKFVYSIRYIDVPLSSSSYPFEVSVASTMDYSIGNWIFYRLTDVMLMQAEALIELAKHDNYVTVDDNGETVYDQDLARAFGLIWTVNTRSIMVSPWTNSDRDNYALTFGNDNSNYYLRANLRELCQQERKRELMFEGKRWFDLVRQCHKTRTPDYVKSNVSAKSGGTVPVNYEQLFWPYSKNEVKNNSLLDQKDEYKQGGDEGNYESTK